MIRRLLPLLLVLPLLTTGGCDSDNQTADRGDVRIVRDQIMQRLDRIELKLDEIRRRSG